MSQAELVEVAQAMTAGGTVDLLSISMLRLVAVGDSARCPGRPLNIGASHCSPGS